MSEPARTVLDGRYEVRELLAQGGMAAVYRGCDLALRRDVAIKVLRPTLAGDVDRERFAAEARVLASLDHPHLVTLLDAGIDCRGNAERPWLVMELVQGPSLAQRIAAGPLDPAESARIGAALASALAHVHANGIVHRDVKPANILLTTAGDVKLADFGVARMTGEISDLTGTGQTIGTAAYLAPEQAMGLSVTGATDVYALGLVLLEASTGVRAYPGPATESALARLHRGPLIPISLGSGWVRLLDEMTASQPVDRPDAAQVAARLAVLSGEGTRTRSAVLPTGASTARMAAVVSRPRWSRKVPIVAAAMVAMIALAGGTAWMQGGSDPTPPVDPGAATTIAPLASPSASATPRSTSASVSPRVVAKATPPKASHAAKHAKKPGKAKRHGKGRMK